MSASPPTMPPGAGTGHIHHLDPVERTVRRVLQAGIAVSLLLMAAGVLLLLARGEHVPHAVAPLGSLWAGLADGDAAAYLSLGLIVLIATPFARVAGSIVTFARVHDRRYVLVSAIVLAVMCCSVLLGRA